MTIMRMRTSRFLIVPPTTLVVLLLGCISAQYTAPKVKPVSPESYTRVINKSYDETWSALIQYAGGAFFSIDNFEKASGLLTLSFGSSRPSEFITGGQWEAKGTINFSGDYVDYLARYANGQLQGKMNIVVVQLEPNKTKVSVRARYIFTSNHPNIGTITWSFDSGGYDTQYIAGKAAGTPDTRTLMPTYKAEKAILDAIDQIQ